MRKAVSIRPLVAACDDVATIPGSGRVQSLNVAAAAAILIYGITRGGTTRGQS